MGIKYTVRMQFGPHQDPETVRREVLEVCRAGRVDEVMFFAFAEEQNDGHETLERLQAWMAAIRPWKRALEAEGIEVSLNPWHSILHEERFRTRKPGQDWQTLVDWRGTSSQVMVCPLDPNWRTYYGAALRLFAAERFRVIWIDDDIRYHNHGPLDWGACWCPLHIDAFNRRAGVRATREEVVAACLQTGEPHPWRAAWFDLWDESHCELIDSWRKIVEGAGSRLGLMSSNLETHSAEGRRWNRWWPALARRFPATHRPHFWGYADGPNDILVYGIGQLQQNRMVQPAAVEVDPEIENFPYGPWNKSFRETFGQMTVAAVFGADRLAVSLYDFMGNLPSDEPQRAAFLGRVKPALEAVAERFAGDFAPCGVGVPWHPDMSRRVHTDGRLAWQALEVSTRAWDRILGPLGFTFHKTPSPHVNALAGDMAWCFDDDTLRSWLGQGLLLDGPAAAILVERGFGDLLGMDQVRFIGQHEVLYAMEESLDDDFGLRPGAQIPMNGWRTLQPRILQGRLDPEARLISVLRSPTQEKVAHGAYRYKNRLRGRVAVMPWDAASGMHLFTQRRAQIEKVLGWLARHRPLGQVDGAAWLVPQFLTDGSRWRGAVWNAGPDEVAAFEVSPPFGAGAVVEAEHYDAHGRRHPARVDGPRILLDPPAHQWELVLIDFAGDNGGAVHAPTEAQQAAARARWNDPGLN